ncbi:MAG TPA: YciI family protein, partial [Amaricoccus sp.]|uniref:YciI family protein n=1 Tax=Amaricoccus sp. TaxID=1872485 RepID=UPI002D078B23
ISRRASGPRPRSRRRRGHIPHHAAYLEQGYADGVFFASGRKHPRTGGVILATCGSRATMEKRAMSDPFVRQGLASVSITEFHPSALAPVFLSALASDAC